jgi:hypothetical protein
MWTIHSELGAGNDMAMDIDLDALAEAHLLAASKVEHFNLVFAGAVHIDNVLALQQMSVLIASINKQEQRATTVLSVSCASTMQAGVTELVKGHQTADLVFLTQKHHLSQFEHYVVVAHHLLQTYRRELLSTTWLMFADHDDEWDPFRVAATVNALHSRRADEDASFLFFPSLWFENDARLVQAADTEHWSYAMPFVYFEDFLARCNRWQLSSPYCDLLLIAYMRSGGTSSAVDLDRVPAHLWYYKHHLREGNAPRGATRPKWLSPERLRHMCTHKSEY